MSARILLKQSRFFATTQRRGSILDYFKPKFLDPALAEPSTKDVINKVETTELKKERIPIIGKRNKVRDNLWRQRMNGFRVESWIPNISNYKKLITDESLEPKVIINHILLESFNEIYGTQVTELDESFELNDLQNRFQFTKKLQIEFGVKISDYELTKFKNLKIVKKYLEEELLFKKIFNEKEPDAIHLNQEDFKGTNVFVSEYISEGQKEKKFKQLLRQAKKLEKLEHQKLINSKLQEA